MYSTRILRDADRSLLDAFLSRHADSSMLIRGNLELQGVEDRGERFQGPYAGAFDAAGALRAAAVHFQRGNVCAAADDEPALDAALRATAAASGRRVEGLIGPRWIVERAQSVLGLEGRQVQLAADEGLYTLDVAELRVPALLTTPGVELRALRPEDRALMIDWHCAYQVETLGDTDGPELRQQEERYFERLLSIGERCLLTVDGVPVATSGFNARTRDARQVGGVFTPRPYRSRGYARATVAGMLLDAQKLGATRGVLFTGDHNLPAITAYRALGFQRVGDWKLTLFR
jgi:predicted GNAT family acetyltransferase